MKRARLLATAALLALSAGAATVHSAAEAGGRIRPDQHFTAYVNGSTGNDQPVVIRMACFGPIQPGQTGHPFGGQTVAVERAHPHDANTGFTGPQGGSIGAFFGALPPGGAAASSSYIRFTRYGILPIPRSMMLPCSGRNSVNFIPIPVVGGSQGISVPVEYVGQP